MCKHGSAYRYAALMLCVWKYLSGQTEQGLTSTLSTHILHDKGCYGAPGSFALNKILLRHPTQTTLNKLFKLCDFGFLRYGNTNEGQHEFGAF